MFIDTAKIYVASGAGGNGCNSFFRSLYLRHPRPNGGPGGDGGNIIIKADEHIQTLLDFQYRRHFKADHGKHGSSNDKKGANAVDLIIKVPAGTIVKDAATGLVLRDLASPGEKAVVCKAGKGGRANAPYKEALPGSPGQERELILELKVIADVGIVGFPNAGKSTFISRVSKATPKIADFPFTTKAPVLGIVDLSGGRRFVLCEIPGLIEGAHLGKGLGLNFLKHAERTKVLIHLVDIAAVEGRDPTDDYRTLNKELDFYNTGADGRSPLHLKKQIVVLNKIDLPQAKENLKNFKKVFKKKIYPISGATGEGIKELLEAVWKEVRPSLRG